MYFSMTLAWGMSTQLKTGCVPDVSWKDIRIAIYQQQAVYPVFYSHTVGSLILANSDQHSLKLWSLFFKKMHRSNLILCRDHLLEINVLISMFSSSFSIPRKRKITSIIVVCMQTLSLINFFSLSCSLYHLLSHLLPLFLERGEAKENTLEASEEIIMESERYILECGWLKPASQLTVKQLFVLCWTCLNEELHTLIAVIILS